MSRYICSHRVQRVIASVIVAIFMVVNLLLPGSFALSSERPEIKSVVLDSGQGVYVQEIHTQPIVTIDTWINTGSAQEIVENNGVSHFLEHLLFKGTEAHKIGEIDRILESRGADFNAATSDDFTHYHITTASPYFKEALELHADMLLNANMPPAELDRERKVVQEEINRSLDNPSRKGYIALIKLLFGKHPYSMDTLGPKYNIQNLPRESILEYYHRWYQPKNFKTVITGDVDTKDAIKAVDETFKKAYNAAPRPEVGTPHFETIVPVNSPNAEVLADPNLSAVQLQLGFLAPAVTNRGENYALDIAAMLLGQGASSRLYQHLKEDRQLVNSISAGNSTSQQAGTFYVGAEVKPENREAAKKAIIEEINRFKLEGPTQDEMDKAKTQVIKSFEFLNESTEGVAGSIGYNVSIASLEDYTEYVTNIQKVSQKEVLDAAQKYLDMNRAVLVEVIPGESSSNLSGEAARNVELLKGLSNSGIMAFNPEISNPQRITQEIYRTILPGGATLLMKPYSASRTVAFEIFAKGGSLAEPKPGLSSLMARVLLKGTKNRTTKELNQEIERLGLSLGASSDDDYIKISGASTSEDLDKLLLILSDVLANPTFPQEEIDKERSDILEEIKTSRDQPSSLMFEKLTEALYREHSYGAIGQRIEASLPNITRDEIVSFYQQEMSPGNLVVAVSGNFDSEFVERSFQQILGELDSISWVYRSGKYLDVKPLPETVSVESQKPEQAAVWVSYGWLVPGISRSRDFITLKVINTLLGSGLSSRLFVDLREKQGLAYHVSSSFPSKMKQSNFVMYIGTDPKNIDKVQEGFNEEIRRLKSEPVPAKELEDAKSKLIGAFALAHESNASQAMYLGFYETLGVGYKFDKEFPELIKEVTSEDIQRVARIYFSQPKVISIVTPKSVRSEASINAD